MGCCTGYVHFLATRSGLSDELRAGGQPIFTRSCCHRYGPVTLGRRHPVCDLDWSSHKTTIERSTGYMGR